jgi:hypothetical protein
VILESGMIPEDILPVHYPTKLVVIIQSPSLFISISRPWKIPKPRPGVSKLTRLENGMKTNNGIG